MAVALLVPSLDELRFEPGKPAGFALGPTRRFVLAPLTIPEDVPVWKILLVWLGLVVNAVLFLMLLHPEVRKRLLRKLLGFALGVLAFVLALRYHVIKWPEVAVEAAPAAPESLSLPGTSGAIPTFRPPPVASWLTYAIGALLLWLALVVLYFAYRFWQQHRVQRSSALDAIANIARSSLKDLAAGSEWGDVVMQAYVRMSEAARASRGLERESSATPREFSTRLASAGLPSAPVEELTRLFEAVRYGGRPSDDAGARRAAACLESILVACGGSG